LDCCGSPARTHTHGLPHTAVRLHTVWLPAGYGSHTHTHTTTVRLRLLRYRGSGCTVGYAFTRLPAVYGSAWFWLYIGLPPRYSSRFYVTRFCGLQFAVYASWFLRYYYGWFTARTVTRLHTFGPLHSYTRCVYRLPPRLRVRAHLLPLHTAYPRFLPHGLHTVYGYHYHTYTRFYGWILLFCTTIHTAPVYGCTVWFPVAVGLRWVHTRCGSPAFAHLYAVTRLPAGLLPGLVTHTPLVPHVRFTHDGSRSRGLRCYLPRSLVRGFTRTLLHGFYTHTHAFWFPVGLPFCTVLHTHCRGLPRLRLRFGCRLRLVTVYRIAPHTTPRLVTFTRVTTAVLVYYLARYGCVPLRLVAVAITPLPHYTFPVYVAVLVVCYAYSPRLLPRYGSPPVAVYPLRLPFAAFGYYAALDCRTTTPPRTVTQFCGSPHTVSRTFTYGSAVGLRWLHGSVRFSYGPLHLRFCCTRYRTVAVLVYYTGLRLVAVGYCITVCHPLPHGLVTPAWFTLHWFGYARFAVYGLRLRFTVWLRSGLRLRVPRTPFGSFGSIHTRVTFTVYGLYLRWVYGSCGWFTFAVLRLPHRTFVTTVAARGSVWIRTHARGYPLPFGYAAVTVLRLVRLPAVVYYTGYVAGCTPAGCPPLPPHTTFTWTARHHWLFRTTAHFAVTVTAWFALRTFMHAAHLLPPPPCRYVTVYTCCAVPLTHGYLTRFGSLFTHWFGSRFIWLYRGWVTTLRYLYLPRWFGLPPYRITYHTLHTPCGFVRCVYVWFTLPRCLTVYAHGSAFCGSGYLWLRTVNSSVYYVTFAVGSPHHRTVLPRLVRPVLCRYGYYIAVLPAVPLHRGFCLQFCGAFPHAVATCPLRGCHARWLPAVYLRYTYRTRVILPLPAVCGYGSRYPVTGSWFTQFSSRLGYLRLRLVYAVTLVTHYPVVACTPRAFYGLRYRVLGLVGSGLPLPPVLPLPTRLRFYTHYGWFPSRLPRLQFWLLRGCFTYHLRLLLDCRFGSVLPVTVLYGYAVTPAAHTHHWFTAVYVLPQVGCLDYCGSARLDTRLLLVYRLPWIWFTLPRFPRLRFACMPHLYTAFTVVILQFATVLPLRLHTAPVTAAPAGSTARSAYGSGLVGLLPVYRWLHHWITVPHCLPVGYLHTLPHTAVAYRFTHSCRSFGYAPFATVRLHTVTDCSSRLPRLRFLRFVYGLFYRGCGLYAHTRTAHTGLVRTQLPHHGYHTATAPVYLVAVAVPHGLRLWLPATHLPGFCLPHVGLPLRFWFGLPPRCAVCRTLVTAYVYRCSLPARYRLVVYVPVYFTVYLGLVAVPHHLATVVTCRFTVTPLPCRLPRTRTRFCRFTQLLPVTHATLPAVYHYVTVYLQFCGYLGLPVHIHTYGYTRFGLLPVALHVTALLVTHYFTTHTGYVLGLRFGLPLPATVLRWFLPLPHLTLHTRFGSRFCSSAWIAAHLRYGLGSGWFWLRLHYTLPAVTLRSARRAVTLPALRFVYTRLPTHTFVGFRIAVTAVTTVTQFAWLHTLHAPAGCRRFTPHAVTGSGLPFWFLPYICPVCYLPGWFPDCGSRLPVTALHTHTPHAVRARSWLHAIHTVTLLRLRLPALPHVWLVVRYIHTHGGYTVWLRAVTVAHTTLVTRSSTGSPRTQLILVATFWFYAVRACGTVYHVWLLVYAFVPHTYTPLPGSYHCTVRFTLRTHYHVLRFWLPGFSVLLPVWFFAVTGSTLPPLPLLPTVTFYSYCFCGLIAHAVLHVYPLHAFCTRATRGYRLVWLRALHALHAPRTFATVGLRVPVYLCRFCHRYYLPQLFGLHLRTLRLPRCYALPHTHPRGSVGYCVPGFPFTFALRTPAPRFGSVLVLPVGYAVHGFAATRLPHLRRARFVTRFTTVVRLVLQLLPAGHRTLHCLRFTHTTLRCPPWFTRGCVTYTHARLRFAGSGYGLRVTRRTGLVYGAPHLPVACRTRLPRFYGLRTLLRSRSAHRTFTFGSSGFPRFTTVTVAVTGYLRFLHVCSSVTTVLAVTRLPAVTVLRFGWLRLVYLLRGLPAFTLRFVRFGCTFTRFTGLPHSCSRSLHCTRSRARFTRTHTTFTVTVAAHSSAAPFAVGCDFTLVYVYAHARFAVATRLPFRSAATHVYTPLPPGSRVGCSYTRFPATLPFTFYGYRTVVVYHGLRSTCVPGFTFYPDGSVGWLRLPAGAFLHCYLTVTRYYTRWFVPLLVAARYTRTLRFGFTFGFTRFATHVPVWLRFVCRLRLRSLDYGSRSLVWLRCIYTVGFTCWITHYLRCGYGCSVRHTVYVWFCSRGCRYPFVTHTVTRSRLRTRFTFYAFTFASTHDSLPLRVRSAPPGWILPLYIPFTHSPQFTRWFTPHARYHAHAPVLRFYVRTTRLHAHYTLRWITHGWLPHTRSV